MTRPSLTDIRGLGDFATLFRWNISLTVPDALKTSPLLLDVSKINLHCESIDSPPKATNQKMEANIRGHKIFQPGITQYNNTLQLTCAETVDNYVHKFFKTWRTAIWSAATGTRTGTVAQLLCDITLERLDNTDTSIWTYLLKNAWLEDYEPGGSLDGTSSDYLKPSLTFSYDYFVEGPDAISLA